MVAQDPPIPGTFTLEERGRLLPAPLDWDKWEPWAWSAASGAGTEAAGEFAAGQ